MVVVQIVIAISLWQFNKNELIPKPGVVADAFIRLMGTRQLFDDILVSLGLTVKAMFYSILITLFFCYLSVIPFFRTLAAFLVKCRYLTLVGLSVIFMLITQNGSQLKLSLLMFGIVPFFVTSFLNVIVNIDKQQFELCKTLGYNKWQTLFEVIIVGKADQVLEIIRQNFAIAWLMITYAESLSLSEGGIGAMMYKYNRLLSHLPDVIALQLIIFLLGIFFDFLLGTMRKWLFPYTKLQTQQG
jgi:NitT/TauT family transport system permease protein